MLLTLLVHWSKLVGLVGNALFDCLDEDRPDTLVRLESEFEGEELEEDIGDAVHAGMRRMRQARHISKPLQAVASARTRAANKGAFR